VTPAVPTPLEPSALPCAQRVAMSWWLRTLLSDADLQSVLEHGPVPAETWRVFVRGELLDLVSRLEGAGGLRGGE
jgi:hypothetical protein